MKKHRQRHPIKDINTSEIMPLPTIITFNLWHYIRTSTQNAIDEIFCIRKDIMENHK